MCDPGSWLLSTPRTPNYYFPLEQLYRVETNNGLLKPPHFVSGDAILCPLRRKIAATVAAGAVGLIESGGSGGPEGQGKEEDDTLTCVNVTMTKTNLNVAICSLPTDVAYNRWVLCCVYVRGSRRWKRRNGHCFVA